MILTQRVLIRVIALGVSLGLGFESYHALPLINPQAVIAPRPIVLKMRRTCEACPNYAITASSAGILTYEGGDYALVRGVRTYFVDASVLNGVIADFVQSDFVELDSIYPAPGSNHMTLSLSIEMDGLSKDVLSEDRYGPVVLQQLEQAMDDLPGLRSLSGWTH